MLIDIINYFYKKLSGKYAKGGIKMFNFNHVAISVSNNKKSIEFYKKFGFKEFKTWRAEDESIKIDMLKLNDMILEIFCYKDYESIPESARKITDDLRVIGTKHFALGVDDINEAKEFVMKNDICNDVEINKGRLGKEYFFISDPDGILVEIIENDK